MFLVVLSNVSNCLVILVHVLFATSVSLMFSIHATPRTNILLSCYICLHLPCNIPVLCFTCDICLSTIQCVHQAYIHHTYTDNMHFLHCLFHNEKMAAWYKYFACILIVGSNIAVLLCAMSTISVVATVVAAVALKMNPISYVDKHYHRLPN